MEESDISLAAPVVQPKTILLISFISSWSQKKMKQLTTNEGQKPWVGCFWKDLLMGNKKTKKQEEFWSLDARSKSGGACGHMKSRFQQEEIAFFQCYFTFALVFSILYPCRAPPPPQPLSYLHNNLLSFTPMNEQWQRCPCDPGHMRCCCGNSQT